MKQCVFTKCQMCIQYVYVLGQGKVKTSGGMCVYLETFFLVSMYLRPRAGRQRYSQRGRKVSGQRVGQTSIYSSWDSSAPLRAAPASAHSCPPLHTGTGRELPGQSVLCKPSWGLSQSTDCLWGRIYRQTLLHTSCRWHAPPHHPQRTGSSPLRPRSGGCAQWASVPARSSSTPLQHVRGLVRLG